MAEFESHKQAMMACDPVTVITIAAAVITIIDWLWTSLLGRGATAAALGASLLA